MLVRRASDAGRLRKVRLIEQYGADYCIARFREALIANCPKFNWNDPCRAYYGAERMVGEAG